ncbi:MAG: hypothetical protein WBG92_09190, partial [Thiohalocapsa sp.]
FRAYADAMPNNCVFLVDTYDTLEGVRKAARIGRELKQNGHKMVGIRLDSGDLAYLSIEARKILDEAGLEDAAIVASNDLDENIIESLQQQGAKIGVWGVGTKLVTAYDQPAMGGVYKLAAIREGEGVDEKWRYTLKLSEQAIKISNPGVQQVRRFARGGKFLGDMIYNEAEPMQDDRKLVDPADMTRTKKIAAEAEHEDLLVPVMREGEFVYEEPGMEAIRARTQQQLAGLHSSIRRFMNPHEYPVGLETGLHQMKTNLILKARGLI